MARSDELDGSGENLTHGADHEVDVGPRRDERRRELYDGVAPVVGTTDEPASEHLGRHVAAKETFRVLAGPRLFGHLVLHQFHAPEVSGAAYVADDRDVLQIQQALKEVVLVGEYVLQYLLVLQDLDALERDGARDGVTGPREAVDERRVTVLEGLGQAVRHDHRPERGVAGRDALRAGDDVRHVVVLLTTEPGTESPEGADDVVRDQDDAVAITDLSHRLPIVRRGSEATTGVPHGL